MPKIKKENLEKALNNLSKEQREMFDAKRFQFKYHSNTINAIVQVRCNNTATKPPLYIVTDSYQYISSLFPMEGKTFTFDYKTPDKEGVMYKVTLKNGVVKVLD